MDIREQSELQILRISTGAHELTNMIDSLYMTASLSGESIQVANGLLRSSLELQESLSMLSRLQKASRRMSKIDMKQRGREEGAEENYFKAKSSKSWGNIYRNKRWQEPRVSVDGSSTNSVEELKQVIRDKLCMHNFLSVNYDNEKSYSKKTMKFKGSEINFISQENKLKAPNLIAKLMGLEDCPSEKEEEMKVVGSHQPEHKSLEEIIETMRSKGILKSDHSEGYRGKADVCGIKFNDHDNEVPPIVIMKSLSLAPWEREDVKFISEKISAREKITLAELLLEDKAYNHGCLAPNTLEQIDVKSIERYNTEPLQKLSTGAAASQRQQKKEVMKESKMLQEPNKTVTQGRKLVESEEVKVTGVVVNQNSAASTMLVKRKHTVKADDQRFKGGKMRCSGTGTHTISRSNSTQSAYGLPKQTKKEPDKSVIKDHEEIRKDHKLYCEVMPRANQAGRTSRLIEQPIKLSFNKYTTTKASKSQQLIHLLLSSQSFRDYAHDLLGIKSPPMHCQTKNPEQEVGGTQLLLDCAKELMVRKSHVSISQMLQNHARERSKSPTLNNLLEEISSGIENLSSYSEIGDYATPKNGLYIALEKELQRNKMMLNASWDDGWENMAGTEEAVQVVIEVVEQITFVLIMEVVVDFVA